MPITIKRKGFGLITTAKEWTDYYYQVWNLNDYIIIKRPNQPRKFVKIPDNRTVPIDDKVSFIFESTDKPIQYTNNQQSDILNQYKHYKHLLTGWLIGYNLKRLLTWSEYPKLFIMGNDKERETLINNLQRINSNIPINPEDIIQSNRLPKRKDNNIILIDTNQCTETTTDISNITIPIIDNQNHDDIIQAINHILTYTPIDTTLSDEDRNYQAIIYLSGLYNPPSQAEIVKIYENTPKCKQKTIASQFLCSAYQLSNKSAERDNIVCIPQGDIMEIRIKTNKPQTYINICADMHVFGMTAEQIVDEYIINNWYRKIYENRAQYQSVKIRNTTCNAYVLNIPISALNLNHNSTGE